MQISNTPHSFGLITRVLHWLTALLVFSMIPLGIIANDAPFSNDTELARKFLLFTVHKTLGVTVLGVALIRILWAISQPKPGPLHPTRKVEGFLAALVHWLLYASLVLLPITGWIEHAAIPGLAPIWWPFGQSLPFVTASTWTYQTFGALHVIFGKVLMVAIFLHVAGAIKHHVIDKDATLRRMWSGRVTHETEPQHGGIWPGVAAFGIYLIALGVGFGLGQFQP